MTKEAQSQSTPPKVEKGKKAVWHKPYDYTNSKGTKITIRGHWEVIDEPKKGEPAVKPKANGNSKPKK